MLPRRSAVLKVVFLGTLIGVVIVLLSTGPDGKSTWNKLTEEWEIIRLDEDRLRKEFHNLKAEWNFTYDADNKTKLEILRYVKEMKDKVPVNPHRFQFSLNPTKLCFDKNIFLLSYIHTAPDHHKRRTAIRNTWGNLRNFKDITFRIVFLMGKPTNQVVQDGIQLEYDMYGDIVQEDFIDSYRNLTFKAIMGMRWISNYCSHAKYILKADDDIFVNIFNVIEHFKSITKYEGEQKNMIQCLVWSRMKVVRDPKSKWYIPRSEFTEDYFPTYCSGSAYMFSGDVIPKMYNASFNTQFFWVDDFYITGLLASKVGAKYRRFNSVYSLAPSTFLTKFTEKNKWRTLTFGHVHNLNWWDQVWGNVMKERRPSTS